MSDNQTKKKVPATKRLVLRRKTKKGL